MRKMLGLASAVALLSCVAMASVQALPVVGPTSADDEPGVTLVAQGCGPGSHRVHGHCRWNGYGHDYRYGPGVFAPRPYAYPPRYHHLCPYGFHLGPHGQCFQ